MASSKTGKLTNKQYKNRLLKARKYFNFSFDARNKLTPARKAAITRAYNKVQTAEKDKRVFIPMSPRQRRKSGIESVFSTSKGVFVPRPNLPKKADFSMQFENGAIVTETDKYIFKSYTLIDPIDFMLDPMPWVRRLPEYDKADFIRVNIGKFQHMGSQVLNESLFNKYVTTELVGRHGDSADKFITGVTLAFKKKRG